MSGGYKLKVEVDKFEEQRQKLKEGFLHIHNGLMNVEEALSDIENKGLKGKVEKNITELMELVKSDVIAPSDRYNDLVISNLNVAETMYKDL